jgi:hypothetical protein
MHYLETRTSLQEKKRNRTQVFKQFSTIFLLHPSTARHELTSIPPLGLVEAELEKSPTYTRRSWKTMILGDRSPGDASTEMGLEIIPTPARERRGTPDRKIACSSTKTYLVRLQRRRLGYQYAPP